MKIETVARRIMRKTKGWRPKDMADDYRDHPKEHVKELQWLIRELDAIYKAPNPRRTIRQRLEK